MNDKLQNYVLDPKNSQYNFQLALEYEKQFHTASAAGYYLRVTEFSRDNLEIYEALLRMALCFSAQGNRVFTVTGLLLRAISLLPERPEAYFLLARAYERNKDWQEAYTWAVLGEKVASSAYHAPLQTNVEYPGSWALAFERAVASWWIGLHDESLHIFRTLKKDSTVDNDHAIVIRQNLEQLSNAWKNPMMYTSRDHERLRIKFNGSEMIKKNYSQCFQDLFVLTMLDGRSNGWYLEIGSGDPWYGNNTALLERKGWKGVSIDIHREAVRLFKADRKNFVKAGDATTMDIDALLTKQKAPRDMDYLQVDCDPAQTSMQALLNVPFHKYRFAVITFEHDHYLDDSDSIRDRSCQYLRSLGYVLAVNDVGMNKFDSFEDWWVHPQLLDKRGLDLINHFNHYNSDPNQIDIIMFH